MYIIPLDNLPNQKLNVTIPINSKNTTLTLFIRYQSINKYWVMDIIKNNNTLVANIPLVCGINLLQQYGYLGIGSAYIINQGNNNIDIPDNTNLGTDFILAWGDN